MTLTARATLSVLAGLALVAPLATGCTKESRPAADFPAADAGPRINLLEAGQEPRRTLRWHAQEGKRLRLAMGMDLTMKIDVSGAGAMPPVSMPMKVDVDVTYRDVKPDGSMKVAFVYSKVSMNAPGLPPAASQTITDMLQGLKGSWAMTDRGVMSGMTFDYPPGSSGQMAQMKQILDGLKNSMDQLSAPFPEEAIGPGARWEVLATVEANGMKVLSTITYKLVSLEGETGRLELEMKQTAPDQVVKMPGMPPGAKARLIKMETKGGGAGDFDLGNPLALKLASTASSDMEMEVEVGDQKQEMSMEMDMKISLEPRALPAAKPGEDEPPTQDEVAP